MKYVINLQKIWFPLHLMPDSHASFEAPFQQSIESLQVSSRDEIIEDLLSAHLY